MTKNSSKNTNDRISESASPTQQLCIESELGWEATPSPKINPKNQAKLHSWTHAYAGFSYDFAQATVKNLNLSKGAVLLDPFMGTGTSALAAVQENNTFVGVDLDPFTAIISRAKLCNNVDLNLVSQYLDLKQGSTVNLFCKEALEIYDLEALRYSSLIYNNMLKKFQTSPAQLWRSMLNDDNGRFDNEVFTLAALLCSAKQAAKVVRGSNPVWLKKALKGESTSSQFLQEEALKNIYKMHEDIVEFGGCGKKQHFKIYNSSFQSCRIRKNSIDGVLTSPPYLNRLDYIIKHLPENSLLSGLLDIDINTLRKQMMGTTKMVYNGEPSKEWGNVTRDVLNQIKSHPSKASISYYYKFHFQYFDTLWNTLSKLKRVCKKGAIGVIVIQDSFYKEIRIPLLHIIHQMGESLEIEIEEIRTENVRGHMGSMSPNQKSYVKTKILKEHVLKLLF